MRTILKRAAALAADLALSLLVGLGAVLAVGLVYEIAARALP